MPLVTSHPSDPSVTANATFTFSDAEQGVAFMCSLDGPATYCNGITTYVGLADGSHTFSVTATDTTGNQSAANVFSWTIHTTTPPSPHIDSALASLPNQIAPAFAFSDAQAGVVFTCQLDAAQPALCSSPAIYVGLADGIHTFSVIASDPNSGRSSTPATFAWTKDTTPPAGSEAEGWGAGAAPNPNRLMEAACTRTRTSRSFGTGRSTSLTSSTSCGPYRSRISAFIRPFARLSPAQRTL